MHLKSNKRLNFRAPRYVCILIVLSFFASGLSCTSKEEKASTHYERARQYIEENRLKEAAIELLNVIKIEPGNDSAHYDLGETYLKLREDEKAVQAFQRAQSINPENMKAQLKMGQIFLILKQTSAARKIVMTILEKSPNNLDALHLLAGVQVQEKNPDAAIGTLEKAAEIDPQHAQTFLFLAQVFFSKGELEKAERLYLKAISLDSASPIPYLELTRLYGDRGQWEKAETMLKKMVETPGQKPRKFTDLARFYEGQKQWDEAEKAYLEAVAAAAPGDVDPLMKLGAYYVRRGSNEKALESMKEASTIKKEDPDILIQIARLYFDQKRMPESEATVDAILGKYPEHPETNVLKGRFHLARSEFASALEKFDLVIKETPKDARAHYFRAMALLGGGARGGASQDLLKVAAGYAEDTESWERELAAQSLAQSLESDPNFLPARLLYIELCLKARNARLARSNIEIALKQAPDDLMIMTLLGKLKFLEGDVSGAEDTFKKILKLDPDYFPAHVAIGLLYGFLNRHEDALKALNRALELNPLHIEALKWIVTMHLKNKDFEKALKVCQDQKRKVQNNANSVAEIEFLLGNIHLVRAERETAQRQFKAAIDRDPHFLPPYMALAGIYMNEKKVSQAIEQYETALNINPKYLPAYMALGIIHKEQGDTKLAENYYRKALEINRDYVPAANNLAFLLAETGERYSEAMELAERAKAKRPRDPVVMDTLGWVYYRQGRYQSAIIELEGSLALRPNDAQTNYHLGWAYYEMKKFDKAREYMRKALEIDPHFKGAQEARSIVGG